MNTIRQLAEQDPSNAGWQRDLAVSHSQVGRVLEAQGKLAEALAAHSEELRNPLYQNM
jgi:Flp pilus assembly protein TadD